MLSLQAVRREVDLQSEHKSNTNSFEVIEAQVSRLRPALVRHDVCGGEGADHSGGERARSESRVPTGQVFTWRRQAAVKSGPKTAGATGPTFAMVALNGVAAGGIVEVG
jgi:hypothetical protein